MADTITIQTSMQKKDYHRFLLDNTYRINRWKNLLSKAAVSLIITLVLRTVYAISIPQFFAAGAVVLISILLIQRICIEIQYRLETGRDQLKQFDRLQTLRFQEEEIFIKAEKIDQCGKIPYDRLLYTARTSSAFYLYLTPKTAAILPCRMMNDEEISGLTSYLSDNPKILFRAYV